MVAKMKVYHVELLSPFEGKYHFYFGSQTAIYEALTAEQLGITLKALSNHVDLTVKPYTNKLCIIRLGELQRKSTNRGRKIK